MTRDELGAILRGIAPVMREALAASLDGLSARLKAIEDRPAVRGEQGERGLQGEPGAPGADGVGLVGPQGERGADGLVGPAGPQGEAGRDGADGPVGERGPAGDRGERGIDGAHGPQGPAGERGAVGERGLDGLGADDYDEDIEDDGRIWVRRWKAGDRLVEKRHKTAMVIYRGVFVDGKSYDRGDMVTWGGSTWHAKETTTIKPDETMVAARSWQLAVKRGREGKAGGEGKRGAIGPKGDRGEPGPRWS